VSAVLGALSLRRRMPPGSSSPDHILLRLYQGLAGTLRSDLWRIAGEAP